MIHAHPPMDMVALATDVQKAVRALRTITARAKQLRAATAAQPAPPITLYQKGLSMTTVIHKELRGQNAAFDALCVEAEAVMRESHCNEHEAMARVVKSHPALYAQYAQGPRVSPPPPAPPVPARPVQTATVVSVLESLIQAEQAASTPRLSYADGFSAVLKTAEGRVLYEQYLGVQRAVQIGKAVTPSAAEREVEGLVDALLKVPANQSLSRTEAIALVLRHTPGLLARLAAAAERASLA